MDTTGITVRKPLKSIRANLACFIQLEATIRAIRTCILLLGVGRPFLFIARSAASRRAEYIVSNIVSSATFDFVPGSERRLSIYVYSERRKGFVIYPLKVQFKPP